MGQQTKTQKTQQPFLDLNTLLWTQTNTASHGKKRASLKCQELLDKSSGLADGCCCQDWLLQGTQTLWGLLTASEQGY